MTRFELQKKILTNGHFYKLICGAGNEDANEVYKLTLVYSLAGALGVDVSANPKVVAACREAVLEARRLSSRYGMKTFVDPFITVSVGMPGDQHVRKAQIIESNCTSCGACIPVCPTEAIPHELKIIRDRCIGCGACAVACQDDAIQYHHNNINIERVLQECIALGAENIELHANILDHKTSLAEWKLVASLLPHSFVSLCTDRGYLSNHELRERVKMMLEVAPGRMIVQADGIPMSGGKDDFNTTLQAIATADIVAKTQLPVFLLLSGGTNSKSIELSKLCAVPYAGVSIGTYARHRVYKYINTPEFPNNGVLEQAVIEARKLVETCYTYDGIYGESKLELTTDEVAANA